MIVDLLEREIGANFVAQDFDEIMSATETLFTTFSLYKTSLKDGLLAYLYSFW